MPRNNKPAPAGGQRSRRYGPFKIINVPSRPDQLTIHLRKLPIGERAVSSVVQDLREKAGRCEGVRRIDVFVAGELYLVVIDGELYHGEDAPAPVQLVSVRADGSAVIERCIYCAGKHTHGQVTGTADDHRTAHCVGLMSPGYLLRVEGLARAH
jgi:hypothetical protein